MTKPLPIEYIAGVIDARGHIAVNMRHSVPQPRIRLTTRRLPLLEHFAKVTGTKVVRDDRGYERRPCHLHCDEAHLHYVRQSVQVTVDSARATIVLFNVKPFIVGQKDEVEIALNHGLKAFPPPKGDTIKRMEKLGWEIP